jgi:hypothetical protein
MIDTTPKPHLEKRIDFAKFEAYVNARRLAQYLFLVATTEPLRFPARRRRKDREVPKAA